MAEKYSSEGEQILKVLRKADAFSEWMYEQVRPYLHGNVLEIGSGVGTYSEKVIRDFPRNNVVLSDIDPSFVSELAERHKNNGMVDCVRLDLTREEDMENIPVKVDSAFALNVLEHIEDDVKALDNVYNLLQDGGAFVVLVPAHKSLYNSLDRAVHHFRRYTKSELKEKVAKTGFVLEELFFFNALSIAGWFINGNILGKTTLNENAVGLLNRLVPFLRPVEKHILRRRVGVSLVAVLRKPGARA